MLCVYWYHSEYYYFGIDEGYALSYIAYPFYMTFFFFISGYLFFPTRPLTNADLLKKAKSLLTKLLWPYFVFTSLIWLPKALQHGNEVNLAAYVTDVFGGTASWFIAALIVAELILIALSYWIKDVRALLPIGIIMFAAALAINQHCPGVHPWYYCSGMMAVLFMTLGGIYRKYEDTLKGRISKGLCALLALLYLAVRTADAFTLHQTSSIGGVNYDYPLLNFLEEGLGIAAILTLVQLIRLPEWLSYIGKQSLPFYFMSGACPTLVSALFHRIVPAPNYGITLVVITLSLTIAYAATILIERYLPFMLKLPLRQ